jgi:hypothetical protein
MQVCITLVIVKDYTEIHGQQNIKLKIFNDLFSTVNLLMSEAVQVLIQN